MKKLVLLATEASGDLLGGRLMAALKEQGFDGIFLGLGGKTMEREGLITFYPLSAISFALFIDVILRGVSLLWRVRKIANKIIAAKPDGIILIDSYDLNHRIARSVFRRAPEIKIINYVPPKAWVWRAGRAKKMKKYIHHCLTLFPFEADFFSHAGIPSSYVGHPALEHVATPEQAAAFAVAFRAEQGQGKKIILIGLGSRSLELKHLGKIFGKTLPLIKAAQPDVEFMMPIAATMKDKIDAVLADWEIKPKQIVDEKEKQALFAAADVALVASGTITLELGVSGTAAVCVYRLSWIEERIIALLATIKFAHLVNLVLQEKIFPEVLGRKSVQPPQLAAATLQMLNEDKSHALVRFQQALATDKPPSHMAAEKVRELIYQ